MSALPADLPESHGVPSQAIEGMLRALETEGLDPHAFAIARHGRLLAQGSWAPYRPDDAALVYSLSKSFTSTAVGFAIDEGLLGLDDTLASFFPGVEAPARSGAIRVRDLLAMATGHEEDTLDGLRSSDPVAAFLAQQPEHAPGTHFVYHNGATFMLSGLVTRVTGLRLGEYLRPRLFDPLGIGPRWWAPLGPWDQGFSGLHLTVSDVLGLGQTYLDGGHFGRRRVLPEGWAELASRRHVANGGSGEADAPSDWAQGYGFQFWRSRHGYRGDGAFGQLCLVLPELDMVIAQLGATEDMQALLDVWWSVLPSISDRPLAPDARAAAALQERLRVLEVPVEHGGPDLALGEGEPPSSGGLPFGDAAVRLEPDGDAWVLRAGSIAFGVGSDEWRRTHLPLGEGSVLPVAARGGPDGRGGVVGTAVITASPHRVQVSAGPDGAARAVWHTTPLASPDIAVLAVPEWAAGPARSAGPPTP